MSFLPPSLQKLIAELAKLPSIGNRSAERLAYYLTNQPELAATISDALKQTIENVSLCSDCFFVTDNTLCGVCEDTQRDSATLCIVEKPADVIAIEQASIYKGVYHVLHSLWAPLRGQTADDMNIDRLLERITSNGIKEVIIATGATVEGEATALYLAKLLGDKGIKATRLAQGLPKGGELEYLDDVTLTRALSGRTEI